MYCKDVESCFGEINAYCTHKPIGRVLLVNSENYTIYQKVKAKLEVDGNKKCVYVSECCPENELPNMDDILGEVTGTEDYVLVGYSQAAMLRGIAYLKQMVRTLLEVPVSGHTIVLLDHCEQYIKETFILHPDISKRVVMLESEISPLPRIRLAVSIEDCVGYTPLSSMKRLLAYFEGITDEIVKRNPEVTVITKYSPELFRNALLSVTACDDIYSGLCRTYHEIAAGTEYEYGSDEEWMYLAEQLADHGTLSSISKNLFGSTDNLSSFIGEVIEEGDKNKYWFLWLCMKVFNNPVNKYLYRVMKNSTTVEDFEEHAYFEIINIKHDDPSFKQYYTERRRLLDALPENLLLIDQFCLKIGIHQKDSIYYLTNLSDKEELAFMQCLEKYDYSKDELMNITEGAFPSINSYLKRYVFDVTNTKVPAGEENLRDVLTEYFEKYKIQKLTNRIFPEFLEEVERISTERPYNKLQARSAIVSKLNKDNAQLYFFDALGVEYLGFIQDRCQQYGLMMEISVAHCELPSITEKNKEFLHYFPQGALDIKELDELKHHSQVIDYEQCKEPVHLFRELQIIDEQIRKIQSRLRQGQIEKAIVVSDHGASRLAVIFEQENEKLELEEKGKHSGRCCPSKEDPGIPYVSYWDGYAVLANYERFKGGRKANVEVHGGATLEEVVVPIIVLSKKPTDIDICFVDPIIILKGKEPATIVVFSNIPLSEPKLVVNEKVYVGEFCEDNKHAKFIMPELKRTKDLTADFYDGDKKLASGMEFHVQRNTQEQSLFKKGIL